MNNPLKPLLAVAVLAVAWSGAGAAATQAADPCPNAAIRGQQNSTQLPNCRAYELVTPVDKNGGDASTALTSSPDGNRMAFYSPTAFAGAPSNSAINSYVAVRGTDGWMTHAMVPKVEAPNLGLNGGYHFADFTEDLSESISLTRSGAAELNVQNVFITKLDGSVSWLTAPTIPGTPIDDKLYVGRSLDGSHLVFEAAQPFSDEATAADGHQVWEWVNDRMRLASILPDGTVPAATGASLGNGINGSVAKGTGFGGTLTQPTVVSEDGSRIFFGLGGGGVANRVFVRIDGTETRELSVSQRTGSIGQSPLLTTFEGASADGNVGVFSSPDQLTNDATPNGGVYAYDLRTGVLRFLSSGAADPSGAQIEAVPQVSRDGSRVYFLAKSVLVPGKGVAGGHNLYVSGPDGVSFIATLGDDDAQNWINTFGLGNLLTNKTSRDGRYFVFQSWEQITSFDNRGHEEVYLYDAYTKTLACVSCGSAGHVAGGDASIVANPVPRGGTVLTSQSGRPRVFTDDSSRIFFQTSDPLVSEDVNDVTDVYEYRTETGEVVLLSSGRGGYDSEIADNSPDGRDVYIFTRDSLLKRDTDGGSKDIYDARVDGGLPDDPPEATPCVDDACQPIVRAAPTPSAPLTRAPTSGGVKERRAPRLLVRQITAAGRKNVVTTGRLTLVASVEAAGTVRATGTASYGDHTVRSLKSASANVKSAATRNLHLSLPRAVRSQLRHHHRVRLSITVSYNKAISPVRVAVTLR
jgi:hypothetical protein